MSQPTERKLTHSESQAIAQLESIRAMVAALECDYERLETLRDERNSYVPDDAPDGADEAAAGEPSWADRWASEYPDDAQELADLEREAGECASREDAEQRIHEDALCVEVRSGWYTLDRDADTTPAEYCILLCTGGPAVRLRGDLDRSEPTSARLEHQDWGTPWTAWPITRADEETLLTYARQFYFGE